MNLLKVSFNDLSTGLQAFVVLGWITIMIVLLSFLWGFISGLGGA